MSAALDLLIRAPRVSTTAGEVARCIGVRDGRIVAIEPLGSTLTATQVVDLGDDEVLMPGLVDTHVHVNEPGRTEWEGFATATRAAAAGGVTTIIDMPLNSIPPTVNVEALEVKRDVARQKAYVDVGFWGGAVPGNLPDGFHHQGAHRAGLCRRLRGVRTRRGVRGGQEHAAASQPGQRLSRPAAAGTGPQYLAGGPQDRPRRGAPRAPAQPGHRLTPIPLRHTAITVP
jgi:hypothetical protein